MITMTTTPTNNTFPKIAVIGAGLSGITVARSLENDAEVTIFEKSRGVGGRMATRRNGPHAFDHGAQYFTIRSQEFKAFIQPLIESGIIAPWEAQHAQYDGSQIVDTDRWKTGESRYVGVPGMNSVVKHLSNGITILRNTRITSLTKEEKWILKDEQDQRHGEFDWVISTIPAPQAKLLLPPTASYYADIAAVSMRSCFAVMLGFADPPPITHQVIHIKNADISWIALNSHKPGRANTHTVVIHSSEEYAEAHSNADHDKISKHLCSEVQRITGIALDSAIHTAVHLWRYANNATREPLPVFIDYDLQLASCGDWCCGGRVEGAFTSSYRIVQEINRVL